MGKDNVPFHTVIFPATLLGTGEKWTMMRNIRWGGIFTHQVGGGAHIKCGWVPSSAPLPGKNSILYPPSTATLTAVTCSPHLPAV